MGNKKDMTSLYVDGEQMPLFPGYEEPDAFLRPSAGRRVTLILGATGGMAGVAAALLIALRLSSPALPSVPIPSLSFDLGGGRRTMFTASVLTTIRGKSVTYIDVEKLTAEEKKASVPVKRVNVEPGTHTLIRVPTSFGDGKPVPIARLWHPIDEKMQSFSAYRYSGDEPPFHAFYYSRPLAQKLDFGRNPAVMVEAGDLIYVYVYSAEVLSLYF